MVIVHNGIYSLSLIISLLLSGDKSALILGATLVRESYKYMSMLIAESIFSLIVAISNVILIFVLVVGWRTLMRVNSFFLPMTKKIYSEQILHSVGELDHLYFIESVCWAWIHSAVLLHSKQSFKKGCIINSDFKMLLFYTVFSPKTSTEWRTMGQKIIAYERILQ